METVIPLCLHVIKLCPWIRIEPRLALVNGLNVDTGLELCVSGGFLDKRFILRSSLLRLLVLRTKCGTRFP